MARLLRHSPPNSIAHKQEKEAFRIFDLERSLRFAARRYWPVVKERDEVEWVNSSMRISL